MAVYSFFFTLGASPTYNKPSARAINIVKNPLEHERNEQTLVTLCAITTA